MHWFDPASRQKKSKQMTDLTQQAGRKNQSKRTWKLFNHPQWSTTKSFQAFALIWTQQGGRKNQSQRTSKLFSHPQQSTMKSFQAGALIWPRKQAERIKAKEQASYSTIHNSQLRKASKQVHWFDPASWQKESKQKIKDCDPASWQKDSTSKKHPSKCTSTLTQQRSTSRTECQSRCTDLTQQAGRKNQRRRTCKLFNHPQWSTKKSFQEGALIWPSKQSERIKREEQASYSTIHNGRLRKNFQAGTLIWPSKQAERIKREEQASYSTIHNAQLRKASKQVHWFDPTSRQKESKKKNKQVIQPSTMVDYESFQAGALIWHSKQAERIKREEQASYSTIHNGRLRKASKEVHWFDTKSRQKESKKKNKQVIQPSTTVDYETLPNSCTDLTKQAGRKYQKRRTSKLFNHPQRSTTKSFQAGALIWPGKQAERIKADDWFDPASRQKESKQKNRQVIQPSTMVDYEKLPSRCTDLTRQAGRKNQSRRLIWPSKQAERIKAEEQASYSTIHNGRLRKASKQVHWFDPASRQKESNQTTDLTQQAGRKNQSRRTSKLFNHPQWSTTKCFRAGALIWPSKQAERIKAKEQARFSTIHNGPLRNASKQVHWFDPVIRQKESKQMNKRVIQPSTTVDYEKIPNRCTDLSQQAGRKNHSRRLFLTSKQAERIKAEEHASYSTIHNGRLRTASKKLHWFDQANRQKESKQKTDLTQQAGRNYQRRRTCKLFNHPQWATTKTFQEGALIWSRKQGERIKREEQARYSNIYNGWLRKASTQEHWFDPASRQKESKQKTDLTQQAGRKNQSRRTCKLFIHPQWSTKKSFQAGALIWPGQQAEKSKQMTDLTQQAGRKNQSKRTSKLFNHPQRSTTKSFQTGALIWPSKQAEKIKAKEQASYSTIHNGRLRKAYKQVHWFDPGSRQKELKQKNKHVIQTSTTVDFEKFPTRCTDLTQQAGRKNQSKISRNVFNHP